MKIIDKYILKRYLATFTVMLLLFIPIGIVIDVSEKVNKMIEKKIPMLDILLYYGDFTVYFANLLFPIFLFLLIMDIAFFSSNLFKFFEGGWVPILIALAIVLMMVSWISGRERMLKARWDGSVKIKKFLSQIKKNPPKRVAGTAIFFVPNTEVVPMALLHNLKHNRILHKRIVFMHLSFTNFPKLGDDERVIVKRYPNNFYNIIVRYGFQEEPNIPRVLALIRATEFKFSMLDTSFFIGKVKVVSKNANIFSRLFILMHRTMLGATEYYKIPKDRTVEIGGVIEI